MQEKPLGITVEPRFAGEHSKQGRKGGGRCRRCGWDLAAPGRDMWLSGPAQRCWQQGTGPQSGAVPGQELCLQPLGCPSPPPALPSPGEKPQFQRQPGDDAALPSSGCSQPKAISLCSD